MRNLFLALALCAAAPAAAQVHVDIQIPLPPMPGLVVVRPGVEVVEQYDEEVFVHGGWFWMRRGPAWYRSRSPQANFVYVEPRVVPRALVGLPPPGHYRHYRGEAHAVRREWRHEERERRQDWKEREKHEREARKEQHEREKERRQDRREDRREDRRDERGQGREGEHRGRD